MSVKTKSKSKWKGVVGTPEAKRRETSIPKRPLPREPMPAPRFHIRQVVSVAERVAESGVAMIVGCEWSPANGKLPGRGWAYWLVEIGQKGESSFAVSEEELISWDDDHSR